MKKYDVAVLGGGPGGYTAAFRAADLGLSVCLVEKDMRLGGTCLNVGCIPSKTLLHAANVVEEAIEAAAWGVNIDGSSIDTVQLAAKKEEIVTQLTGGLATLCEKRKITRIEGAGIVKGSHTLEVVGEKICFKNLVLATGSLPFRIPGLPEDDRIWNSTDALALKSVPKSLLIIGGGIIGLEMAQVYHALGSRITIVEMQKQIVPPADKDMVNPLVARLKKRYTIYTETRVTAVTAADSVEVSFEGKKAPASAEFDAILVAVGRKPNSTGMGFKSVGLDLDEQGFMPVNERQQTNIKHIYAVGDLVGNPMLAHKATHEGKVAAENIAGHDSVFTPKTIPSVAYTSPELAWVGLTEKEAKEKAITVSKGKFPWGACGRALSMGASGVTKALFDKKNGRLLGAAICGANAGELIHEAVLAIEKGATAEDISLAVHAHPTLAETFAFAAEIVDGSITDALPPKSKK